MNYWMFECTIRLNCPILCEAEYSLTDMENYDLTVRTSSSENAGTRAPVYIQLWGAYKRSPKKLLSEKGYLTGSLVQSSITTGNVGDVTAITLFLDGDDNWMPQEIIVRKINSSGYSAEAQFFNTGNYQVDSIDKGVTIKLNNGEIPNGDDSNNEHSSSVLDETDRKSIIKLSCRENLKDNENFGPSYGTSNVNFMTFLASCPSDCLREQQIAVGLGIHPEESAICINAIVDQAVSNYGGIISINIFRGLESYTGGRRILGISVEGSGNSKRSYTIAKVDNIDMIEHDVRILDSEGKSSYKGRIDIRYQGVWGTVCAVKLENSAAQLICKQIGYNQGKFLNPSENEGRGFCSNYEGANHCGVTVSPILFSDLSCQGNEESIIDCYRKIADRSLCTHQYDALIECGNLDSDQSVSFQVNTIRLIDSTNNPTKNGIGRLEILKGKWGSICSNKFDDNAAKVSCRQMGYLDGSLYGQAGSNNVCLNVLGDDLCGDFSLPIKLTEVVCSGHESSLYGCEFSINTVSCTQFNNVILKCEGFGDSSGKSQNLEKPKVLNPMIKKLPMPPNYNAKCESNAKNLFFRGDPGSVFLVNCPSGCMTTKQSITGTGIYTIDSSICKAAIHSGVITKEGGNIALVKSFGQNKYFSHLLRSVSSLEASYSKASFFLAASNSAYERFVSMLNIGSFLQVDSRSRLSDISHFSRSNNLNIYSSFLETINNSPSKEAKAFYEWTAPSNDFIFDGHKTSIDLSLVDSAKSLLSMKTFTIYFEIKMNQLKEDSSQTIFSIGGCDGMSISLNSKSELIVDIKCGKKIFLSGLYVPINFRSFLSLSYDGVNLSFYFDGEKKNVMNAYFHLNYKPLIFIGKSSEYNLDYFEGKVFFIAFFMEALDSVQHKILYQHGYIKPNKISLTKFSTLDNRECISSCVNQLIPGYPFSPTPPTEAITYAINGVSTVFTNHGSKPESADTKDLSPYIEVKCTTTARELFNGKIKVGDKKRIKCPKDCGKDLIFGTIIYSFDSSMCVSGIHSGVMKVADPKMILIKALPGMNFYQGTLQYNVQSTSIDKCDYSFSTEEAPEVISVDCETTTNVKEFSGTLGTKYLVRCPANCSKKSHNVFGNNLYSGDSSICQSAIHCGASNDRGGEVQFIIDSGQKLYYGLKAFGINSKERESYVKSIRFINANNNLFTIFKEDYKNEFITTNWEILDNLNAIDYPSKWEYQKTPETIRTSSKFLLHQSHATKSVKPMSYGTILLLKNSDVVNSKYILSIYLNNLSPVGIIFRYKDDNNYYHLRINNLGTYKLCLVKKIEGKSTILGQSSILLNPKIWYSFTLLIYHDSFKVFIQIGDLRNNQLIMDLSDNDIQRGSLGIASDGNNDFYVNGISIDDYKMNGRNSKVREVTNRVSFENILEENTEHNRRNYCTKNFITTLNKCQGSHFYCKSRCDDAISYRENILNYNCYRSCVRDFVMKTKIQNMQHKDEVAYGLSSEVWSPKVNEKCDYKQENKSGSSPWVAGYIKEVKNDPNDPEQKILKIKFKNSQGTLDMATVLYPSIEIKKCGVMLQSRDDCSKTTYEFAD